MQTLKKLRMNAGYSQQQLAEKMNVSRSAVAMWESGASHPDNTDLIRLAKIFHTTTDFLLDHSPEKSVISSSIQVPVLEDVRAGISLTATEEIRDYEEVDPSMATKGKLFALRVKGNSMEPRMHEGDVIICAETPDVDSGTVAVVLVNGDEATVKRVDKFKGGLKLIAFNPSYDPVVYTNDECEELPVRIIGRVIELRAKF